MMLYDLLHDLGGQSQLNEHSPGTIHVNESSLLLFPSTLDHGPTQRVGLLLILCGTSSSKAIYGRYSTGSKPIDRTKNAKVLRKESTEDV